MGRYAPLGYTPPTLRAPTPAFHTRPNALQCPSTDCRPPNASQPSSPPCGRHRRTSPLLYIPARPTNDKLAHPNAPPPRLHLITTMYTNETVPFVFNSQLPRPTRNPLPPARSASALDRTMHQLPSAARTKHGITSMIHSPNGSIDSSMSNSLTNAFAPNGSAKRVAHRSAASPTSAPDVDQLRMELVDALALRGAPAQTPYKPDTWEYMLYDAGLLHEYGDIPHGLRHGFIVEFPITRVQPPPNSPSVIRTIPKWTK